MFVAAIKCDFCKKAHEIPCRKSGDIPTIPDGWASVSPMIRIKGTPKDPTFMDKEWCKKKQTYIKGISEEGKRLSELKKAMTDRRDKLRAKFDKSHVCEDCIELIITGKRSIKIGMDND